MLIATITALLIIFGGESLSFYLTNLKGDVKEYVQDKERQKIIIDTSKALSKDLKALGKRVDDHFKELVEVHSEYDSVGDDFDAASAKLMKDQNDMITTVLDARDAMHEQMTKEEWEAVFAEPED